MRIRKRLWLKNVDKIPYFVLIQRAIFFQQLDIIEKIPFFIYYVLILSDKFFHQMDMDWFTRAVFIFFTLFFL